MDIKKYGYSFFQNRDCEYFPCHIAADVDNFNCLFCYCPLYTLGDGCGGNFKFTENGIKDCSDCLVCHAPNAMEYIKTKFPEISRLEKSKRKDII